MAKITIKNSNGNPLISYIKENNLQLTSVSRKLEGNEVVESIKISTNNPEYRREMQEIIDDYGSQLYHNTTFNKDIGLDNLFNYSSNSYENTTSDSRELELPNFYIENLNEQNMKNIDLKSIGAKLVSRKYIENIGTLQGQLVFRNSEQLLKFKNIVFPSDYLPPRSYVNLKEFPYYNRISLISSNGDDFLKRLLEKISFQEELLGGILSNQQSIDLSFDVNGTELELNIKDLIDILQTGSLSLNLSDKIILGGAKKNNYMLSNFKRNLVLSALNNRLLDDMLSFSEMLKPSDCKNEVLIYRVDKFRDNDSEPLQTFWSYDTTNIYDYQIKRDGIYKYKLFCYCLIYGTETRIVESIEDRDGLTITIRSMPSYKYTMVNFGEDSVKVSPKLPLPPFVNFYNENSADNKIKIYLSLKSGKQREKFIEITENDSFSIDGIKSKDGLREFEHEVQDGKFEVYRMAEKPKTLQAFRDNKSLDIRSALSTTDVIFTDDVKPNKKYYYMFRSINFIGAPSNPSPVYEVELIKDASNSRVVVKTISLEEEKSSFDKTFKNLIQVKPAFQQDIFNDQEEFVSSLTSFDKKINDITLGTAKDKIWGKKFKIRLKSKDTGKIIDLNVKFNLIKDNIK